MMQDISGKKFGRLTAFEFVYRKDSEYFWKFKCDCGKEVVLNKGNVVSGHTKSCGCLRRKHGFNNTRIYHTWEAMKQRCYNKNCLNYRRYGGRSIKICDEWIKNPSKFFDWAFENGYKDNLTIDRIDNDGDYCPENCRWASSKEQGRNKSINKFITYKGKTKCQSEWEELLNLNRSMIYNRASLGWSLEKIMETPIRRCKKGAF